MYNVFINDRCIGCGICSLKCPIQSIYGVLDSIFKIVEEECVGCRICVLICPVNCIKFDKKKINVRLNRFVIREKVLIKENVFLISSTKRLHFDFNNYLYVCDRLINYQKNLF